MKKYIIEIRPGTYIEKFFGASILITDKITSARGYTKSIAKQRIEKNNLTTAKLIPVK